MRRVDPFYTKTFEVLANDNKVFRTYENMKVIAVELEKLQQVFK